MGKGTPTTGTRPITIDILIKNLKTPNNEITKLTQNDINSYVK